MNKKKERKLSLFIEDRDLKVDKTKSLIGQDFISNIPYLGKERNRWTNQDGLKVYRYLIEQDGVSYKQNNVIQNKDLYLDVYVNENDKIVEVKTKELLE